ncbi:hypothetical protein [Amycolatopsis solani]|uniref:hypothetical protein n=1 Tax=Amycolatopsis solani TaxID=3028615 RepID=UPI0025B1A883|nr:hypothetical protein [Amycolatopsis sp. MEP2-6]
MAEGVSNEVGTAYGPVVQARDIHGDVHVHQPVAPPPVAARPISGWSARELGVHEAIALEPPVSAGPPQYVVPHHHEAIALESPVPAGPPRYVVRRHDHEVRRLLAEAADDSLMVVLVGGSASGKTRAAYEAVRAVPHLRDWPVVRPSGPRQLVELLARGGPPRRVWWLPDLRRRFLDLPHGPAVAEALAHALSGPGPLLVVADVWTADWARLSTVDAPALVDLPQVRMVRIADSFAGEEAELTRCAALDPRLALATRTAERLAVTQVLSGGPQLLRYYAEGLHDPRTHAVITTAMDAARLGCESAVSAEVLHTAAAAYLDEPDRVTTGDWFADALTVATRPHHGIAALTPTRRAPGLGPPDGFVLHDFLDHYARDARARCHPPAGLWAALAEHATAVDDRARLAASACRRGLYRLAARFAEPAAESGDVSAMRLLAFLLELRGAVAEAQAWRRRTGDLDRSAAPVGLLLWYDDAVEDESQAAPGEPGRGGTAEDEPRAAPDEAELWRRADRGEALAVSMLSVRLRRRGLEQEAEALLRSHARNGDPAAMWYLAYLLVDHQEIDEAVGWFRRSAELSLQAVPLLVDVLAGLGRLEEAEEPLRIQVGNGHGVAAERLAGLLERLGRVGEAEALLRYWLEDGDEWWLAEPRRLRLLAGLLERTGRAGEAARLGRYGIEPGGRTAEPWEPEHSVS